MKIISEKIEVALMYIIGSITILAILASFCNYNSCEDLGKKSVLSHKQMVFNGKIAYMADVYNCE